jgi:hypothetical protein
MLKLYLVVKFDFFYEGPIFYGLMFILIAALYLSSVPNNKNGNLIIGGFFPFSLCEEPVKYVDTF